MCNAQCTVSYHVLLETSPHQRHIKKCHLKERQCRGKVGCSTNAMDCTYFGPECYCVVHTTVTVLSQVSDSKIPSGNVCVVFWSDTIQYCVGF